MRYSLLDYIACSYCISELTCMIPHQEETKKKDSYETREGLLICDECGHWFPIHNFIPELLPDHLRDWSRDMEFLKTLEQELPGDVFKGLLDKSQIFANQALVVDVKDEGINYKKSEISIKSKITDANFFGPGFVSPFNPGNPEFTIHLIRRFGNVLPLLGLKNEDVVLDMGAGYAWTTEWLKKMGFESIGVDICRTYMDIGINRMGEKRPHLVVGDIENLPLKNHVLNAVLCYDAFHHIHNRKKAMRHFFRALKDNGNIVLSEPDSTHEFAEVSKEAMDKYGTLEKGMNLEDVIDYCEGLQVKQPEQHFSLNIHQDELNETLSSEFIHSHSCDNANVFVVKKRLSQGNSEALVSHPLKFMRIFKRKVKRLLTRIFVKLLH